MKPDYKNILYDSGPLGGDVLFVDRLGARVEGAYRSDRSNRSNRRLAHTHELAELNLARMAQNLGVTTANEIVYDECHPIGPVHESLDGRID